MDFKVTDTELLGEDFENNDDEDYLRAKKQYNIMEYDNEATLISKYFDIKGDKSFHINKYCKLNKVSFIFLVIIVIFDIFYVIFCIFCIECYILHITKHILHIFCHIKHIFYLILHIFLSY